MNSFTQLIQQIKTANYAAANQTFSEIMQQKVADRLATERQSIFSESTLTEESKDQYIDKVLDPKRLPESVE